ncbi:glutathione-disulfide reductase [Sphingobium sp. Leaf26]|uniref:glutathione-disulfide reductase n=1 Tax=Sphingobium sp. Leaf26 TaxID=1735693 RepID=UPI0009E98987|nr:glutathione-disulfide reductase [Sphingobium sp. Leaf26]
MTAGEAGVEKSLGAQDGLTKDGERFDYDLFVIGAGSGGVRAARVAAAHGARVGLAEEHRVGGTCVIRGCVPKKLLLYGASFAEDLAGAESLGWHLPARQFDWQILRDNVQAEVSRLNGLYEATLRKHNVSIHLERARLAGPHIVQLANGRTMTARRILLAVGAWPIMPTVDALPGADLGITSNEVFGLAELPRRVVILGGGYIAQEFAGLFNALGSSVSVVVRSETMLRGYDQELVDRLVQASADKGISFRTGTDLRSVERQPDGSLLIGLSKGEAVRCDRLVYAMGRQPYTGGLGLETAGVATDAAGAIIVGEYGATTCKSIFAVGDVTNRVQLTPVAIREGQAFADAFFGDHKAPVDYEAIPSACFSQPPLASVGLTEAAARLIHPVIKIFRSDFRPMKNTLTGRTERALYKMVVDGTSDRVLGLHMIGPDAPEILQAAAIAVKAGLTKRDFDATMALHPSMAEELVLLR